MEPSRCRDRGGIAGGHDDGGACTVAVVEMVDDREAVNVRHHQIDDEDRVGIGIEFRLLQHHRARLSTGSPARSMIFVTSARIAGSLSTTRTCCSTGHRTSK